MDWPPLNTHLAWLPDLKWKIHVPEYIYIETNIWFIFRVILITVCLTNHWKKFKSIW